MYHAVQIASAVLWLSAALWLSGSLQRALRGRAIREDMFWSLACLIAYWVVGFRVRVFTGYAPVPIGQSQMTTDILMHVIGCALAVAVMWKRYMREGWRW